MKDIKAAVWPAVETEDVISSLGTNEHTKDDTTDYATENIVKVEENCINEHLQAIRAMCGGVLPSSAGICNEILNDDEAFEAVDTVGPFPSSIWSRNSAVAINNRRLFSSITLSKLRPHRQIAAVGRTNGLPADSLHNSSSSSLFCSSSLLSSLPSSLFTTFPNFTLSETSKNRIACNSNVANEVQSLSSSSSTVLLSDVINNDNRKFVVINPHNRATSDILLSNNDNLTSSHISRNQLEAQSACCICKKPPPPPSSASSALATSNVVRNEKPFTISSSPSSSTSNVSRVIFLGTRNSFTESSNMLECAPNYRDRKKSFEVHDEFRKRSGTGSSRGGERKWSNRKDVSAQMELRCCITQDVLRSNVEKHWFFEDEQVRINGSVFTKRDNFDNLLLHIPASKFNGIHIKMEDDCPQGGDDVRLCLLKTLGAHNQRQVPCIACHKEIIVYDKYPLIDGTFFLSPVLHHGTPVEVMYEGRKQYLQQICVSCLWSDWKCNNCGRDGWFNGRALILGTLYYYDIISAGKCCPPTCTVCRSPLLIPENVVMQIVNGNYSLMNELVTCSSCGCKELHCIRDTADVTIAAR